MLTSNIIKKIAEDAFAYLNENKEKMVKDNIDVAVEKFIFDKIKENTENVKIVSEEYGSLTYGNAQQTVVVDPIDGSGNLFRKIPIYSVAIALCRGNLEIVSVENIEYSIVVSTFGTYEASSDEEEKYQHVGDLSIEEALMRAFRNRRMRLFGASTIELCLLANGSIDGFVELNGLKSVDLIPELLLLKKSGCCFTDKSGNELKFQLNNPKENVFTIVAARSKDLHQKLLMNIEEN